MAVESAGPHANNLHRTLDCSPHQHLITQFSQAGCSSLHPTNSVKALKAVIHQKYKSTDLHVAEPVSVSRLSAPCITAHVHLHFKIVREADASIQHVKPVRNKLLERLKLQNLMQERLHVGRPRLNERIGVERYPLSRLKAQCITISTCSIPFVIRSMKQK